MPYSEQSSFELEILEKNTIRSDKSIGIAQNKRPARGLPSMRREDIVDEGVLIAVGSLCGPRHNTASGGASSCDNKLLNVAIV